MKLQFPAIAAALVLALSGCTAPQVSKPARAAQSPAAGSDAPPDTVSRARAAGNEGKTPLPPGTVLRVRLYHAIDTRHAQHGDSFIASLSTPVTVNDKTVLPKGTVMRGSIQQASQAGRSKGPALVALTLDRMEWNGAEVHIDTNVVTWNSADRKKRNLAWAGGGSAAGALIGGAAGTGKSEGRIPAESVLTFRLEQPVVI